MNETVKEKLNLAKTNARKAWRGLAIGAFAGYCMSYFFQNAIVQYKLGGFFGYIGNIFTVLRTLFSTGREIEIGLIALAVTLVGAAAGVVLELKVVKPYLEKLKEEKDKDQQ